VEDCAWQFSVSWSVVQQLMELNVGFCCTGLISIQVHSMWVLYCTRCYHHLARVPYSREAWATNILLCQASAKSHIWTTACWAQNDGIQCIIQ